VSEPEWLTTEQLARVLGISGRTVLRYVERGILVPTRRLPSGHFLWTMEDAERQLAEHPRDGAERGRPGAATSMAWMRPGVIHSKSHFPLWRVRQESVSTAPGSPVFDSTGIRG
jgi:hypothetical protein